MAKNKKPTELNEDEKRKLKERQLLDSWHPSIKSAMEQVHKKFKSDSKLILTESDLKCWLFYYLQQERPYIPFAAHTEVTHYAEHEKIKEKFKFRDLSLLCPWEVQANEDFFKEDSSIQKDILSKGFLHKAAAIHFELKFVRETGARNQVSGLVADIKKLLKYNPIPESSLRDLIIVCGSRSSGTKVEDFINTVVSELGITRKKALKERLRFYLFDTKDLVCMR